MSNRSSEDRPRLMPYVSFPQMRSELVRLCGVDDETAADVICVWESCGISVSFLLSGSSGSVISPLQ